MRRKDKELVAILAFLYVLAFVILLIRFNHATDAVSVKPTQTVSHVWTKADSLAYAHDQVLKNANAQFTCLSNLWGKESAWDARAYNPVKVMGKNAGGIPQLIGMSPLTPPTEQIERGLSYIYFRYKTPCEAWKHWKRNSWY